MVLRPPPYGRDPQLDAIRSRRGALLETSLRARILAIASDKYNDGPAHNERTGGPSKEFFVVVMDMDAMRPAGSPAGYKAFLVEEWWEQELSGTYKLHRRKLEETSREWSTPAAALQELADAVRGVQGQTERAAQVEALTAVRREDAC